METIKKTQIIILAIHTCTYTHHITTAMKNFFNGHISRVHSAEKRISEFKDKSIEKHLNWNTKRRKEGRREGKKEEREGGREKKKKRKRKGKER